MKILFVVIAFATMTGLADAKCCETVGATTPVGCKPTSSWSCGATNCCTNDTANFSDCEAPNTPACSGTYASLKTCGTNGKCMDADVPSPGPIARCEQEVAKGVARLTESLIHCHRKRARGAITDEATEESCEDAAKSKFERTNISGCTSCMDLTTLADSVESSVDNIFNAQIYCDQTTGVVLDSN